MNRFRKVLHHLLHPALPLIILLTLASGAALVYIFWNGLEEAPVAYAVFVLSAYSMVVLAVCIPGAIRSIRKLLYTNKHSQRYITDIPYRVRVSLFGSLTINLFFAVFKLVAGILYHSVWFIGVGVYYMVLSIVRFLLLRHMRTENQDGKREWRHFRFCGCLLFVLNVALTGIVWQMMHSGKGYYYPGTLIYAVAAYAFYNLTIAIVGLIRFQKLNIPAVSASKIINLTAASVSIFSMQTAMFASFGGDLRFESLMNSLVGGSVCLLVFGLAVYMVIHANRKLHLIEGEMPEKR